MRPIVLSVLLLAACGSNGPTAPSPVLFDEGFGSLIKPVTVVSTNAQSFPYDGEAAVCGADWPRPYTGDARSTVRVNQSLNPIVQTFAFSSDWGVIANSDYGGIPGFDDAINGGVNTANWHQQDGWFYYTPQLYTLPGGQVDNGYILTSRATFDHSRSIDISADVQVDAYAGPDDFHTLSFGADDGDYRQLALEPAITAPDMLRVRLYADCSILDLGNVTYGVPHHLEIRSMVDHWEYAVDGLTVYTDYTTQPAAPRFKPAHIAFAFNGTATGRVGNPRVELIQ